MKWLALAVCLLLLGCKSPLYEDSQDIPGGATAFAFELPAGHEKYRVDVSIRYSFAILHGSDTVHGELTSPSGVKYTQSRIFRGASGKSKGGVKWQSVQFNDVPYEEGTYSLTLRKEGSVTTLKKATVKVYDAS